MSAPERRISIAIVAAVAENGVIGRDGGLPWRVRSDLRRFRAVTMGKPLIMGRKTHESIGRVLDGRDTIVLTRQPGFAPEGATSARDVDEAVAIATRLAQAKGAAEICVVGGGDVYKAMMPIADRLYISHIDATPEGDVTFPDISPADWMEVSRESLSFTEGDTARAVHVVYDRTH